MVSPQKNFLNSTARVACVILAGGKGTRLFPLTANRCKPAVSFGGRYRLIDIPISNSLNSKMNHIFVISQYFSSGLNQYISETYHLDHFKGGELSLLNPEERSEGTVWYEGTADAVRKNLEHLTQLPIDYFLILSGDQLYNMDLEAMVNFAIEKKSDLMIGALPVSKEAAPRLGLLNIDDEAKILDFQEKPKDPKILEQFELSQGFINAAQIHGLASPSFLASMGIYVFKKEALIELLQEDLREDFGKHMIPTQLKKGNSYAFLHQGYWEDIGTITSFYKANLSLTTCNLGLDFYNEILPIYTHNHYLPGARLTKTRFLHSIICDGSVIEAKEILNSVIGVRSVIGEETIIHDSVLLGNSHYKALNKEDLSPFQIGNHCTIKKAIIDENVTIGNHVTLVNENNLDHYDGEGVFIREGIIVVTSGTSIPDHFKL
jgi:glucose-1-phosphate adenylyltransferase